MSTNYGNDVDLPDPANALPIKDNGDGTVTASFRGCEHLVFNETAPVESFNRALISIDAKRADEGKYYVMWYKKDGSKMQYCGKHNQAYDYPYSCVRDDGNARCGDYKEHDHVVTFSELPDGKYKRNYVAVAQSAGIPPSSWVRQSLDRLAFN